MNICDAVKQALQEKKVIHRKGVTKLMGGSMALVIRPTNSYGCCVVETVSKVDGNWETIKVGILWNPTADDLQAEDWECLN